MNQVDKINNSVLNYTNQIFCGDCLNECQKIPNESVDLIYLDPPFFTQSTLKLSNKENKEYSFDDKWQDIYEYKNYIKDRLTELKRVLKPSGSIFLHCDKIASHYLRIALDEVFGYDNFQSEIIWYYKRWSNSKKGLLNSHQTIFFYSKTADFKFILKYENYSPSTNLDQIFQDRQRKNDKTTYKTDSEGNIQTADYKKGVPLGDVWDIPYLNPKAKERCGYPTQKPILLLEQIISLVTDKNDIVLDPFCGSGTTLVASKLLGRNYIGFDKSLEAVELSNLRLKQPFKTESNLVKKGRHTYKNQKEDILDILSQIGATPVQRNKGIDGFVTVNDEIKPIPIKITTEDQSLDIAKNLIIKASQSQKYKPMILIDFQNSRELSLLFTENKVLDQDLVVVKSIAEYNSFIKKLPRYTPKN